MTNKDETQVALEVIEKEELEYTVSVGHGIPDGCDDYDVEVMIHLESLLGERVYQTIHAALKAQAEVDVHGFRIIISMRDPETNKLERITVLDEENEEMVLLKAQADQVGVEALKAEAVNFVFDGYFSARQQGKTHTKERVEKLIDHLRAQGYLRTPDQAEKDEHWQPANPEKPKGLHTNPDARVWAAYFVEVFPGQKHMEELMFGWFANAMMAMYDHYKVAEKDRVMEAMAEALQVVLDNTDFVFEEQEDQCVNALAQFEKIREEKL